MIIEALSDFCSLKVLLLLTCLLPILWLVYKFVEERLSPLQKIPSPPGALPLVGHVFAVLRRDNFLEALRSWTCQYAPMFVIHPGYGIGVGGYRVVIVDPEMIKYVAVTNSHKFARSDFVTKIIPSIEKGLFAVNGKVHARQKRMIGPVFNSTNLRVFLEVFKGNAEKLVQLWSSQLKDLKPPGGFMETGVTQDLSHLTLDVIGESAFSYKFNSVLGGDSKVSEAFNTVIQGFEFKYLLFKFFIPFFDYLPLKENRRIQSAREISDNIVMEVIQDRRKQKREGNYAPLRKDLLDLLMDMYDEETDSRMEDEELRAQVFTFLLAGNDTTSVAMAWTLYELAKNPYVQERLRSEVQAVFQDDNKITWENLEKLQFLENVLKESLRMHAPALVTNRVALSDVDIGGYHIPKETQILFPIDGLGRAPQFWSNPEIFDPGRFERRGDQSSVQSFSLIAFGCGPRMCIGNKFAMMEMKVVLATLVKNFSFSEVPGCVVKEAAWATVHPAGLQLRIKILDSVEE